MAEIRVPVTLDMDSLKAQLGTVGGASKALVGTSEEKNSARLGLVAMNQSVELLKKIFGEMSKFSPALIGSFKLMETAVGLFFRPFGEALGRALMPAALAMVKFSAAFDKAFPPGKGELGKQIVGAAAVGTAVAGPVGGLVAAGAVTAASAVLPGGELNNAAKTAGEQFGMMVKQWGADAKYHFDVFIDDLGTAWGKVTEGVKSIWEGNIKPVWDFISNGLKGAWGKVNDVWNTIKTALQNAWTSISSVFSKITGVFQRFWELISPILTNVQNAFSSLINWLMNLPIVGPIIKGAAGAVSSIASAVENNPLLKGLESLFGWE